MHSVIKTKEKYIPNMFEFMADYLNDINDLPTDKAEISAGSSCICLEDSSVWILGNDYAWHKLKQYANESSNDSDLIKQYVADYINQHSELFQPFEAGDNIQIENGIITVQTTNSAEPNNTKPISSAGVYTIVGNIESLLEII